MCSVRAHKRYTPIDQIQQSYRHTDIQLYLDKGYHYECHILFSSTAAK